MERMMSEMMDKVIKVQEESDRNFLELEEKRMRLEEYQLKREERDEREFQLRMSMLMAGSPVPLAGYPPYLDLPRYGHSFMYADDKYNHEGFESGGNALQDDN